jgi:hypothetical protein
VYGIEYSDTPIVQTNAPAPSTLPTTPAVRHMTFGDLWNIAFNDKIEPSIRRYARQQVRQRVYMKMRNAEQTEKNLRASVVKIVQKRHQLDLQMEALDELKKQIK